MLCFQLRKRWLIQDEVYADFTLKINVNISAYLNLKIRT